MDIKQWLLQSQQRISEQGMDGVKESLRPVFYKGLGQVSRLKDSGTPIYEREWDLLVVLDACRLDLMHEVAGTNASPFIDEIGSIRSLDSTTGFWMRKNFVDRYADEMARTTYVCGNPFSESVLSKAQFHDLDEVWQRAWNEMGTVPPRAITDGTIRAMRSDSPDRVIAHYMQPHYPFLPRSELSGENLADELDDESTKEVWERLNDGETTREGVLEFFDDDTSKDIWARLRDGGVTHEAVWEGYRANLELVLDEVGLLLRSVDADRAVVSSDHGNSFGTLGIYGHPPHMPHDCLRIVPWIETRARDDGEYEPPEEVEREVQKTTEEQLAALGYK